jgi:hypothetical protein
MKVIFDGIVDSDVKVVIKETSDSKIGNFDKELYLKYIISYNYLPESTVHRFLGNKWDLIEHEHWASKESDVMCYVEHSISYDKGRVAFETKKANLTNEEYAALFLDENGNTLDDGKVFL